METNRNHFQRYRFGSKRSNPHDSQTAIWAWIAGLIIIVFVILGGIKLFDHYRSGTSPANHRVNRSVHETTRKSKATRSGKQGNRLADRISDQDNRATDHHSKGSSKNSRPAFHRLHFSSIASAKAWARATQPRWLHEGYRNFRITNDGQGDYDLQFTR